MQATPQFGSGAMTVVDDGAFPVLDNPAVSFDNVRFDRKIFSVTQEENTGRVAFHIANLANATWQLTDEEVIAGNSDGDCGVCIMVRDDGADGEVLIVFQGDREFSSGAVGVPGDTSGDYQRAYITRRISPGVWSTPQMVGQPNDLFSSPGGLIPGIDYNGAVHIHTGRGETFPVTNNILLAYNVVEPADVAVTLELYCQVYRTDNTLSDAFEFEYTGGLGYNTDFLVGDCCPFSYGGNNYVAMPIGKIKDPYIAIWQDSTTAGMPTKVQITNVEIHADTYGALMPDINVRWAQNKLHVIFGSHLDSGSTEWAVYKTISPPFTTVSPSATAFPRADQIGPVWPANSLARCGSDVAEVGGQLTIFKITSGHVGIPDSESYSILEIYQVDEDLPTPSTYELADFIADNA